MHQKVLIKISASLDAKGYFLLRSNDFSAKILNDYLIEKTINSQSEKELIVFIENEYKNKEINAAVKEINNKWNNVEGIFFYLCG